MNTYTRKLNAFGAAAFSALVVCSANVQATSLSLSQVPIFLGGSVEPNIMFTLDDSGSMHWEMMPDSITYFAYTYPREAGIYGAGDYGNYVPDFKANNPYAVLSRSSSHNVIYYNPAITYLPWADPDGNLYPDALKTCAPHNPYDTAKGCRNFTIDNTGTATWRRATWDDGGKFITNDLWEDATETFWPAVYYEYHNNGGDGRWDPDEYTQVEIRPGSTYTGGAGRTDCAAAPVCTYDEEIQNFANWYTYYRSRILLSRAGVGRAFSRQGTNMRVGFATINTPGATVDGVSTTGALVRGLRSFSGADRTTFFDDLYGHVMVPSGTPLRRALDDVGQYFERTDNLGPWAEDPGTSNSTAHLACRQSFHVMMTDGYWNGAAATTAAAQANVDDTAGPAILNPTDPAGDYQYTPVAPYRDDHADTLADIGMYYWNRDLRTDLANLVPTNPDDPAFWQHLVNFTVGLGVPGSLDPQTDLADLTNGNLAWPNPVDASIFKTDDLWHTALNSRGGFFSASNPTEFADSLTGVLSDIADRVGSAASPALNSGSIGNDTHLYQAKFSSSDWTGQLLAFPVSQTGSLGSPSWDAAVQISAQDYNTGREIITMDPATGLGIPFRYASLTAAQQTLLNTNPSGAGLDNLGDRRVDYIRGDPALENGGGFRTRTSNLADVVHSSPVFVGEPNSQYPNVWDDLTIVGDTPLENAAPYATFRQTYKYRQRIVYFGSNGGLLHGVDAGTWDGVSGSFSAGTGNEEIAYVPNKLIGELNKLTSPSYSHQYYVDGSTTVVEAFYGGAWHSVLSGGYGAGGQGVFTLDVTDPSLYDEANASSLVLWEFTDADDPDLGNTYGQSVNIVRLHNGSWAAIFSNGYNNTEADGNASATGNAVLYIVDVATGTLIRKLDTLQGAAQDPKALGRPNGLSPAAPVDRDGDFIIDVVYAGDLFGNMWKFDLTNPDPNLWTVDFGGQPLFQATDVAGAFQPITVRPQIGQAPDEAVTGSVDPTTWLHDALVENGGNGVEVRGSIVYFGTGQYFEVGDGSAASQTTQTFYAVWDKQLPGPLTISPDPNYSAPPFNRSHLLEQKITQEIGAGDPDNPFGIDLRLTTENGISWHKSTGLPTGATQLGWRMDLINSGAASPDNLGERVVSSPVLRSGRIVFTTLLPDADPCNAGGSGWLMELDADNGGTLDVQPFDLNHDFKFDKSDMVDTDPTSNTVLATVSGKKSTVGIISTPGILDGGDQEKEFKFMSGSSGGIETTVENAAGSIGRLNWQQL